MTFLEIVQMACRESMVVNPGSPDTVVDQDGLLLNFVNWVADGWDTLQLKRPRWSWMRRRITSNVLTIGTGSYSAAALGITSFGRWLPDYDPGDGTTYFTVYAYLASQGVAYSAPLPYMRWETFRATYLRATVANNTPTNWSIDPQTKEMVIGPKPSAAAYLDIDYVKGKQDRLALDATVPELPEEHHPLLAYIGLARAQRADEASPAAVANAVAYVDEHMRLLEREENAGFVIGGDPIA